MAVPDPGCGHPEHGAHCACDVVIRNVVPIRYGVDDWYDGVLARAGIDLAHDPRAWDYVADLMRAEEAKARRCQEGLNDRLLTPADERRLYRSYLQDGGWTSELYEDDRACAINIAPEFDWSIVVSVFTDRNTRATVRINAWDLIDWQNFEQCVIERTPVNRALSRELGVSRYTIERMYAMHGVAARGVATTSPR